MLFLWKDGEKKEKRASFNGGLNRPFQVNVVNDTNVRALKPCYPAIVHGALASLRALSCHPSSSALSIVDKQIQLQYLFQS